MKSVENFLLAHKWWRLGLPIIFVLIWLGLGGLGGPTFGKIGDVESNDQSTFLPASAESTQVQNLQSQFQTGDSLPAVLLVTAPDKLAPSQLQQIAALKAKLAAVDGVATSQPIIGPIPSQDGRAAELIVPVQASAAVDEVVQSLRDQLGASLQAPLTSYVTGPAGLSADLIAAFGGIDGILLLVALAAVFVILLLVYRSIILPIIVLLLDIFALSGAILAVYYLAKSGAISLNGQAQGILSILVIGASTDYSLLLISRYRESLGRIEDKWGGLFVAI
jgi:RND superfamily putative drug exporter